MDARNWAKAIIVGTGRIKTAVSIFWRKTAALIVCIISARLISPRETSRYQERRGERPI